MATLLSSLLASFREVGQVLRDGTSHEAVGKENSFGDHQLHVDVKTDEIIFEHLRSSRCVHVASSEETPVESECGGEGFSVGFDPLDGSSIVGANFAVGTIVAVFPGNGFVGRKGSEMCMSMMAQYGPRITVALAFNSFTTVDGKMKSIELTMLKDEWVLSQHFVIAPKTKTFAPGNLRATFDNEAYKQLVSYWIDNKYTLRYSGGLVPDVYHILSKGGGVLSNASSKASKAKLRLLYECAPIALIVEAAGGASLVSATELMHPVDPVSILDVVISELDKRVGVCYGSSEEVERFRQHIFPTFSH